MDKSRSGVNLQIGSFDAQSLNELVYVFSRSEKRLKEGGSGPNEGLPETERLLQSREAYDHTCEKLRRLKCFRSVLRSLLSATDDEITKMQEALLPPSRHFGLMSLPDEILMHTVDLLRRNEQHWLERGNLNTLIRRLSSVSRRFRECVLSTVSLWTCLDNDYCLEDGFETRIARTKNAPLTACLRLEDWNGDGFLNAFAKVAPLKDRLHYLQLRNTVDVDDARTKALVKAFPRLSFPAVKHLYLHGISGYEFDSLVKTWEFPSVVTLDLNSTVPPPGLFQGLTCLRFSSFSPDDELCPVCLPEFMRFLSHMRCLRHLYIDLCGFAFWFKPDYPVVELPTLSTLEACSYEFAGNVEFRGVPFNLRQILQSLRVPNVKSFHLRVAFEKKREIDDWIASSERDLQNRNVLQLVTTLQLMTDFSLDATALTSLLRPFANIKTLDVDIPWFVWTLCGLELSLMLDQLRSVILRGASQVASNDWESKLGMLTNNTQAVHVSYRRGRVGEN